MKRVIGICMIVCLAALVGCGQNNSTVQSDNSTVSQAELVTPVKSEDAINQEILETVDEAQQVALEEQGVDTSDDVVECTEVPFDETDAYEDISREDLLGYYWYMDMRTFKVLAADPSEVEAIEQGPQQYVSLRFEDDDTCKLYMSDYDLSKSFGENLELYCLNTEPRHGLLLGFELEEYEENADGYAVPGHADTQLSKEEYEGLYTVIKATEDVPNVDATWEIKGKHVEISVDGYHVVNLYLNKSEEGAEHNNLFLMDNSTGYYWCAGNAEVER